MWSGGTSGCCVNLHFWIMRTALGVMISIQLERYRQRTMSTLDPRELSAQLDFCVTCKFLLGGTVLYCESTSTTTVHGLLNFTPKQCVLSRNNYRMVLSYTCTDLRCEVVLHHVMFECGGQRNYNMVHEDGSVPLRFPSI